MLEKVFILLFASTALAQELCRPDAPEAYKVRLSIKTALGNEAYEWNDNEMYLFQATLAFAMRNQLPGQQFEVSNIIVCNITPRVSFWFVVTSVNSPTTLIPKQNVENAIKEARHRINSAFLLTDQTLEFLGIPPTLASPIAPGTPPWLIAFGVVMGIVGAAIVYFLGTAIIRRTRKKTPDEDEEAKEANGIAGENLDGIYNSTFSDEDKITEM
ncbi:hypothetical protein NL108_007043 [Boleophthalmus pectinirostris]|uniref:collectrin n=1 Tax=Boleophthalmus pectinirostris TaxID=150288 RepID=UPI000A1C7378|nr:collectrin [Boleophthalmus pectinirostris]KAJ0065315.1 hypothetical protein NL108_007043 [Boleophthalmus pectinirostris]